MYNQFTEQFSVLDIALKVREAGKDLGMKVEIDHIPDPRVEAEQHYYNAKHSKLLDLGLQPHYLSESLLDSLMNIALKYRDRVDPTIMLPQVNWREPRNDRRRSAESHIGCGDRAYKSLLVVEFGTRVSVGATNWPFRSW